VPLSVRLGRARHTPRGPLQRATMRRMKASARNVVPRGKALIPEALRPSAHHPRRRGEQRADHYAARADPNLLETASELALGGFLQPFGMDDLPKVVHYLIGSGYTTVASLVALTADEVEKIGVSGPDGNKLLLATWLRSYGLEQYGAALISAGADSLITLLGASSQEETLKAAGLLLGHRRQLQRHLREDASVQAMAAAHRAAKAASTGKRGLHDRARGLHQRPVERSSQSSAGASLRLDLGAFGAHAGNGGRLDLDPFGGDVAGKGLPPDVGAVLPHDPWAQPWRTTVYAALVGGTAPGGYTESHSGVRTPRGAALRLVGKDGMESLMQIS